MDLLYRVKRFGPRCAVIITRPAIDITLPGNRHFHLIGGIHMGSHDMAPLPTRLLKSSKRRCADRRGGCFHQRYAFCQFACLRGTGRAH